jgi:hypothetical protein
LILIVVDRATIIVVNKGEGASGEHINCAVEWTAQSKSVGYGIATAANSRDGDGGDLIHPVPNISNTTIRGEGPTELNGISNGVKGEVDNTPGLVIS